MRRSARWITHTLPERNASGRLLEKNGPERVEEIVDPEHGRSGGEICDVRVDLADG